jgi:hypothetical protein
MVNAIMLSVIVVCVEEPDLQIARISHFKVFKINFSLVDGGWSGWSLWSDCSTTCGAGTQTRDRRCDSPAPTVEGQPCPGESRETQNCFSKRCPIIGILVKILMQ